MARGSAGYVDVGRLLGVNRDESERMAGQLYGDVEQAGATAQRNIAQNERAAGVYGPEMWNAGTAMQAVDAQEKAKLLGTQGGRSELARQKYGQAGNYSRGQAGLDAALTGQSAKLEQVSNAYANLAQQLGVAQERSQRAYGDYQHQQKVAAEKAKQQTHEQEQAAILAEKQKSDADKAYRDHMVRNYWSQGMSGGDYEGYSKWVEEERIKAAAARAEEDRRNDPGVLGTNRFARNLRRMFGRE